MLTREPPASADTRKPLYRSLYVQVLAAIAVGVLLGRLDPSLGVAMQPLSDAFVKLLKMVIAPVIFCSLVVGIAGSEDVKKLGRVGGLALLYFEVVSTLALLLGMLVVNVMKPGVGMNVDVSQLDASALDPYQRASEHKGLVDFALAIIPRSLFGAFTEGEILQVLLIAVLVGLALQRVGGRSTPLFKLIQSASEMLFAIVNMVMRLAPIGAFGAMAFTVGRFGFGAMLPLAKLMATFYATCILFVFGVLGLIARAHGISIVKLLAYLRDELMIVLGTSSSEAVLPRMMLKLEALGVQRSVVALVLPTGYSFNLDGTSIYLTMGALFVAQATNTTMSVTQQLTLLAVLLLASKGAAAVTGGAFIVLTASLGAGGGIPVAGLVLIVGIDRFMSEARALTNLVGNALATLVLAKWTGALDVRVLQEQLARPTAPPVALAALGGD